MNIDEANLWLLYASESARGANWLEQARHDFALYLRASRFDAVPVQLKEHLGSGLVDRTVGAVIPAAALKSRKRRKRSIRQ